MTLGLAALAFAAACLLAGSVSLVAGVAVFAAGPWLDRLSPAARARILLMAALAPAFAVTTTALAIVLDPHVYGCRGHLCLHTQSVGTPGLAALLFAALALCGAAAELAHLSIVTWRARRLQRRLVSLSAAGPGEIRILPIERVEAFVLGLLRPRVYVSRGLLERTTASDLRSVLAHETAHVRRRDPLRRLVASLGLALHWPWISAMIRGRLARAQEMAADAEAALAGDASETAGALVRLARLRSVTSTIPAGALALLGGDLDARVRALIAPGPLPQGPSARSLLLAALATATLAVVAAHQIHSGFEALLGALA